MIPEKEEPNRAELFFEILLIGELLFPSGQEGEKKSLTDILKKFGVTTVSSDFTVLDHSRIGNSMITIAKYSLEYMHESDRTGKRVCVEGTVTMHKDELGTRHIRISSRPYPFRLDSDTITAEMSLISDKT